MACTRAVEPGRDVEHVDALVALIGVAHRHQPTLGHEQVELGQVAGIAVAGVGHDEGMRVVALDLGPLARMAQILHGQRMEGELVLHQQQVASLGSTTSTQSSEAV